MSDPLNSLEAQRIKILRQFLGLGDLRPGSISAVVHRCGKSYCHCAKPNDPGHAPQIRGRSPNSTAFRSWAPSS